ncbi:MAG: preprotein translocase subunit SecG [Sedimentisphaerales bacterium]|nr:preprotein translocase subunit SecG [Sedimentisphaerales bacterium]
MTVFPILAVNFLMNAVAVLFVICCIALILIILIQKGRGGGLSGAFGGAMASGILGSKTGDFLTWVTIVLASVVLTLGVVMGKFYKPDIGKYGEDTPTTQVQPEGSEQTASDANTPPDTNSPGS